MLKNSIIALALSLPILANAQECDTCPHLPPEPVESCQLPVGYFYPAQYNLGNCCTNFSVYGEFIYWELNQDDFPQIATLFDFADDGTTTIKLLAHEQGYLPGFKVGVGMGLPCVDNWNINAEYTWFQHTTTDRFNAPVTGFILTRFVPGLFPITSSSLRSKLKYNLNFIEGTLGRSFYLSQRLIVEASVGIKSWWASYRSDFIFDVFDLATGDPLPQGTQFTKAGIWGVGPYVNAKIQALFGCGFYALGKAGIWPAYSRMNKYSADTNYPQVAAFGFPGFVNEEKNRSQPFVTQMMYEGGVGLGWGTSFCDCTYHADLSVRYDMMTNYFGFLVLGQGKAPRAFYYQGLSVRAALEF